LANAVPFSDWSVRFASPVLTVLWERRASSDDRWPRTVLHEWMIGRKVFTALKFSDQSFQPPPVRRRGESPPRKGHIHEGSVIFATSCSCFGWRPWDL